MREGSLLKSALRFFGLLALAIGATFAVPAVAMATSPTPLVPDCKTVVVTLADRPDSGNHGTWATDQITRTVKVCHANTVQVDGGENKSWHYTATVIDDGHFVTVVGAGNSPNNGHPVSKVPGYMGGTFTATFTAPAHWDSWLGSYWNGKTLTGAAGSAANPSTSEFVKALWKNGFEGSSIDNDWTWTYWTCSKSLENAVEHWTDNYKTDGKGDKDGDIVGKPCPSASPSPTMSPTGPATNPPTPTPTPGGLPVTGAKTDWMIGVGAGVLLLGGAAFWIGRRRRTNFVA